MSQYFNIETGEAVSAQEPPIGNYLNEDGQEVEVSKGNVHMTQLDDAVWAFSTGPRYTAVRYGDAPSFHDGGFFQNGQFRFVGHGAENPEVVEDLACEEGRALWGKNYVVTKDGREGPTVDSIRSQKKLKEYMRLTGHREYEAGERKPNKHEELRKRVEAQAPPRNHKTRKRRR